MKKQKTVTSGGEKHRTNNLSEVILGGQDGLVNTLGVILGVAAASQETRIVVAAGLAAAIAESISMAAVAYTSKHADRDYYFSELEREKREIQEVPHLEKQEIRDIYRQKGFEGKLLESVVEVITSSEKVWLDTMMRDELHLSRADKIRPLRSAFVVGISAVAGSIIPLVPFFFVSVSVGIWLGLLIAAVTLFIFGMWKAKMTVGDPGRSGLQMMLIGTISALAGYGIGLLFAV